MKPQIASGIATAEITHGDFVLLHHGRVTPAPQETANGQARIPPGPYGERGRCEAGKRLGVRLIEGLGARSLHAMANAPLMDANRLFLPAGTITMPEYRERSAAAVIDLSEDEPTP